jgi:hypothetical protein
VKLKGYLNQSVRFQIIDEARKMQCRTISLEQLPEHCMSETPQAHDSHSDHANRLVKGSLSLPYKQALALNIYWQGRHENRASKFTGGCGMLLRLLFRPNYLGVLRHKATHTMRVHSQESSIHVPQLGLLSREFSIADLGGLINDAFVYYSKDKDAESLERHGSLNEPKGVAQFALGYFLWYLRALLTNDSYAKGRTDRRGDMMEDHIFTAILCEPYYYFQVLLEPAWCEVILRMAFWLELGVHDIRFRSWSIPPEVLRNWCNIPRQQFDNEVAAILHHLREPLSTLISDARKLRHADVPYLERLSREMP